MLSPEKICEILCEPEQCDYLVIHEDECPKFEKYKELLEAQEAETRAEVEKFWEHKGDYTECKTCDHLVFGGRCLNITFKDCPAWQAKKGE